MPGTQDTCLYRSLALHARLRREGMPSRLEIGVAKGDGDLRSHAWVELDGQLVNDTRSAVSAFVPIRWGGADATEHADGFARY
jgi:hypothetical protein